ncbi:MAG: glycosyltransferase, partial [Alphaproteobacteria bacterium]|nr:glycosyltransferase [Alphaproteobacteria bacterium]
MKKKKKTAVVKRAATVTAMAAAQRKGHKVGAAQGYKSRRGGVVHKRQDDRPAGKKSTGHQQRNNKLATKGVRPNLISVIMPLYNYEQYVGRAIESIINQTHQDWEL